MKSKTDKAELLIAEIKKTVPGFNKTAAAVKVKAKDMESIYKGASDMANSTGQNGDFWCIVDAYQAEDPAAQALFKNLSAGIIWMASPRPKLRWPNLQPRCSHSSLQL